VYLECQILVPINTVTKSGYCHFWVANFRKECFVVWLV